MKQELESRGSGIPRLQAGEEVNSFAQSLIGARPPAPDETGYFKRDEA